MALSIGAIVGIAIAAVVVFIILLIWIIGTCWLIIVRQEKVTVMQRFGKVTRVLTAGWYIRRIFEEHKELVWRRPYRSSDNIGAGHGLFKEVRVKYIDLRSDVFLPQRYQVYTKGSIPISVQAFMTFTINDVKTACYDVDNLHQAIEDLFQPIINSAFADLTFDQALQCQTNFSLLVPQTFLQAQGCKMQRIEISEISPHLQNMVDNLDKQMITERERRANLIQAEAQREATQLKSDGTKICMENIGVGNKEEVQIRSEGDALAMKTVAQAQSDSFNRVKSALSAEGVSFLEFKGTEQYIKNIFSKKGTLQLPFVKKGISWILSGKTGKSGQGKYADLN